MGNQHMRLCFQARRQFNESLFAERVWQLRGVSLVPKLSGTIYVSQASVPDLAAP